MWSRRRRRHRPRRALPLPLPLLLPLLPLLLLQLPLLLLLLPSEMWQRPGVSSLARCKKQQKIMCKNLMENWSLSGTGAMSLPLPARPDSQLHCGGEERHDGGIVLLQLASSKLPLKIRSSDFMNLLTTSTSTSGLALGGFGTSSASATGIPKRGAAGCILAEQSGGGTRIYCRRPSAPPSQVGSAGPA